MTYTKGPWKFEITPEGDMYVRIPHHDIFLGDLEGTCDECFSNGYLIATAPELLEALEMTRNTLARICAVYGIDKAAKWAGEAIRNTDDVVAKVKGYTE